MIGQREQKLPADRRADDHVNHAVDRERRQEAPERGDRRRQRQQQPRERGVQDQPPPGGDRADALPDRHLDDLEGEQPRHQVREELRPLRPAAQDVHQHEVDEA